MTAPHTSVTASSWAPVDLEPIVAGAQEEPPPSILRRTDGNALLYLSRVNAMFGEPEACKGWLSCAAVAEQLHLGEKVVYIDFEDGPASIVRRLLALGVDKDAIVRRFVYITPEERLTETLRDQVLAAAADATLGVLDGTTDALVLQGLGLGNEDVATWLGILPRPLARLGLAVLTIDHVVKDRESRGRYAIGGQHKLAGVDVAYSVEVIQPFGRGRTGKVSITVKKDRPGHVRGLTEDGRVAEAILTSHADGDVGIVLEVAGADTETPFRPTVLMDRVSKAVQATPGLSKNAIRQAVKGKNEAIDLALELLVAEGFIEPRKDGAALRHHPIRAYAEPINLTKVAPSPQPRPDLAPARSPETSPPRPPLQGRGARGDRTNGEPPRPTPEHDTTELHLIVNGTKAA